MKTATKVKRWAKFLRSIRRFFDENGFFEVSTPLLVTAGAFEATIDCLHVQWNGGSAELHTSPEIEMKALLAETEFPIYQVTKCFRDDPPTGIHRREFTMLEFYRPGADYKVTQADMKSLFGYLNGAPLSFDEVTVRELFRQTTGIDLCASATASELREQILERKLVHLGATENWDDMFYKLLIECVEPRLDPAVPTLVRDYPATQCALGKVDSSRQVVERFEIYWRGMEICNGCTELTDPTVLRERYEIESRIRRAEGKQPHPLPQRLMDTLESGLPPASGVAVGLDRLFCCLEGEFPI
jgi:lysyl-tRNA synthetase class 2